MKKKPMNILIALVTTTSIVALSSTSAMWSSAAAAEFEGLWATNPDRCNDIFVKRGDEITFSDKADMYGSGFIYSGKTIRGKIAVCKIQSMKKSGVSVDIRATCATDISISSNNFRLTMVEDNKLVRSVPKVPELDTSYFRCSIN